MWEEALFTYYIAERGRLLPKELPYRYEMNNCIIAVSTKTQCAVAFGEKSNIAIVGVCVDAVHITNTQDISEIAQYLAKHVNSVESFLEMEPYFAGKYVMVLELKSDSNIYIFGDATNSIQINYDIKSGCASSVSALIARLEKIEISEEKKKVRLASSSLTLQMPGDITIYEDISALLPNHYLQLNTGEVKRFPAVCKNMAGLHYMEIIWNIARAYMKNYQFICPITGGKDSRAVLCFALGIDPAIMCFTMHHRGMTASHPDLVIAEQVCKKVGKKHIVIDDAEAKTKWISFFDGIYGKGLWDIDTSAIASTIQKLGGYGIINGDIIGQIGKASLCPNIPDWMMGAHFYQCKIHNPEALKYMKKWYQDAKKEKKVDISDLFSWESRLGRWIQQAGQIYDLMGVLNLNFFNNRIIISEWIGIERGARKKLVIHKEIIGSIAPELLEVPFENTSSKWRGLVEKNAVLNYAGVFVRQYRDCLSYRRKIKKNECRN